MYEELEIKFKNGKSEWYSPIDETKMTEDNGFIMISYYGTLSLFTDKHNLNDIEYIKINKCKNMDLIDSKVIFNDKICDIKEFDNLSNGTYGILK